MSDLPHDARLEFRALGLAIYDETAHTTVAGLPDDLWHDPDNAVIAGALRALHARGKVADLASVEHELRSVQRFNTIGGHHTLERLLGTVGTVSSLDQIVAALRELAMARRMVRAGERVAVAAQSQRGSVLAAFARKELENAAEIHGGAGPADLKTTVMEAFARIEALCSGSLDGGHPLGFPSLDRVVNPMRGGQFIIVAARPACGKSAFMQGVALSVARRGSPVLIFSLEMPRIEIGMRVLASGSGVSLSHMSRGLMTQAAWDAALAAAQDASKLKVFIEDDASMTVQRLIEMAGRIKREHGLGALFVDYAQLLKSEVRSNSREREVAEVSRDLKRAAKQLDVPIVALAQFNRDSVKGGTQRAPTIADLRESGQMEQDADTIILMSRPQANGVAREDRVEFHTAKQRSGPTGTTWLAFHGPTTTFADDGNDNGMPRDESAPTATSGVHAKPRRLSAVATPDEMPPLYEGEDDWSERDAS